MGVAVTQLFRLHAAVYTDTSKDSSAFDPSDTPTASPSTTSLAPDVVASAIASLSASVEYQSQILMQYSKTSEDDRHVFSHLGKPIGATLIAVSMVLLCLGMIYDTITFISPLIIMQGVWRFFLVQRTLTQDLFPPARISIIVR